MAKEGIHPNCKEVVVSCSTCNTDYKLISTKCVNFKTDICSSCHPFYTGKQSFINRGRVEKFIKKIEKKGLLNKDSKEN